jgi:AcrR family transcriptional regulator
VTTLINPSIPPKLAKSSLAKPNHDASLPTPRTQAQRRNDSEFRLINAAREVLARKGWVGMTLAEVGERAGVSRGLASHHFGSKAGLLRALTLHINSAFEQSMVTAPKTKAGLESVIGYVTVYLTREDRTWTNTRTLLLLMAEALVEGSENAAVLADYMKRMYDHLEENIRIGIEGGEIHPNVSPKLGAEMVIGMLRGIMLQRLVKGGDIDMSDILDQMQQAIRRAFGT